MRLNHQAYGLAAVNIQRAVFNQVCVHHRVKPLVINHVVHMPVSVVVHPAGGNVSKAFKG